MKQRNILLGLGGLFTGLLAGVVLFNYTRKKELDKFKTTNKESVIDEDAKRLIELGRNNIYTSIISDSSDFLKKFIQVLKYYYNVDPKFYEGHWVKITITSQKLEVDENIIETDLEAYGISVKHHYTYKSYKYIGDKLNLPTDKELIELLSSVLKEIKNEFPKNIFIGAFYFDEIDEELDEDGELYSRKLYARILVTANLYRAVHFSASRWTRAKYIFVNNPAEMYIPEDQENADRLCRYIEQKSE